MTIRAGMLGTLLAGVGMAGLVAGQADAQERPLTPSYGNISPFYGNISPFYGNISPFYGNISPFYGNISPFWGNISPFWGNISPFYGNISPFWGNISPFGGTVPAGTTLEKWNNIGTFWKDAGDRWSQLATNWNGIGPAGGRAAYEPIATGFGDLVTRASSFWGAAVQAKTGKSFDEGFARPMLSRYGIDLANPESLARLTPETRARFFLEWYDGLMGFSGADQPDHWMKTANWSPKITQLQGGGSDAVIGLVDFFVSADADIKSKVVYSGGYTATNAHGAGVGSLMVASHDGKGVMGIAPGAKVAAYNPFDATFSASWDDVKKGIVEVTKRNAAVVNLSLGVPGRTFDGGWRDVFKDGAVSNVKDRTLYVIAAGNEGVSQTANVNMKDAFDSTFIVVGSVDPTGTISSFSNRPGSACLTEDAKCENKLEGDDYFKKSGYLKNRFIVAPGELILVSDGQGGTVRQSGTSFAAPLVSGAIALIHDRWPWLKKEPRAVAQMILGSAKDLGAPGIDDVYGVGLLDVEASQSPLSFNAMKYYLSGGLTTSEVKVNTLLATGDNTVTTTYWDVRGLYFAAFEKVGGAERDFLIPLSSRLTGTKASSGEYFQDYVYNQMVSWIESGGKGLAGTPRLGLTDTGTTSSLEVPGGWRMAISGQLRNLGAAQRFGATANISLRSAVTMTAPSGLVGFTIGRGAGAVMTGGSAGFAMNSDYDPRTGGANPLLGFASGGAHMSVNASLLPNVRLTMGVTEREGDLRRDIDRLGGALRNAGLLGLQRERARATHTRVDYDVTGGVSVSAAWTRLNEDASMLGMRSLERSDFAGGTRTDGVTLGLDVQGPAGLTLAVAANRSRTEAASGRALLRAEDVTGTAYQVSLTKAGVLGGGDFGRVSLSQPLALNSGTLRFDSVMVIDRETGEKGVVSQTMSLANGSKPLMAEGHYGTALLGGTGQLSLFGRARLRTGTSVDQLPAYMGGLQFRLGL